jgi:regulator of protease activity HflC (stomatin/prohibitin superfamily)
MVKKTTKKVEEEEKSKIDFRLFFSRLGITGGLIIGFFIATMFMNGWYYVPGGSQGAMFNRIEIDGIKGYVPTELGEGADLKIPFFQSVTKLSYKTQQVNFCDQDKNPKMDCHYGPLVPKDINGINFEVDMSIRYHVAKDQVVEIIQQKGNMKAVENIIKTAARADSTRGVFGQYDQEDIPNKREEVSEKIFEKLQERINLEASGNLALDYVKIESLDVRNIAYDKDIELAIITKEKKKQVADAKIYDIQLANRTREEELINADRDRQAEIIRAEGTANATLMKGLAQAETVLAANNAFKGMSPAYVLTKAYDSIKSTDKMIIGLDSLTSEGNSIMMFDPSRFTEGFGGVNSTN